jgi:quinoprotein glucose dehydrogenase
MALRRALASFLLASSAAASALAASADWPAVGNDPGGTRHSALAQINRDTVGQLAVTWTYKVDDADPAKNSTIECTPVVVDGVMYLTTVRNKVVALDAASGREIWRFDPYGPAYGGYADKRWVKSSGGVNRGVAHWSDGKPDGDRRVLLGVSDGRLFSLDAKTGKPDPAFGTGVTGVTAGGGGGGAAGDGFVNLKAGITERDISKMPYGPTSAPAVCGDVVVVGCSNGEGHPAAPGDPRAFNVRTGKELWRFHTIPRQGEPGSETWSTTDYWMRGGGANPWGGFTVDAEAGVVFMGTGSAGPDFYGAGRKGTNLYANCVLALDARTGKRLWHFQTVHHDLWDHDNPCPPVLCHVTREGKQVPAVAQVTKTGYCYVLDRKTGEPLFEVKEVPAGASDVPGEQAHPTQPVPVKPPPLARTRFTEDDVTDRTPAARQAVLEKLKTVRHGGYADPPAVAGPAADGSVRNGSVVVPGFLGGATWSGASFDPTSGLLFVNTNNAPYIQGLKKAADGAYEGIGYTFFLDPDGYPAVKPPWGLLTAVDLSKGEFAWQVPLGEFPELTAQGYGKTGTMSFGGTIVTAGGLVFIGGSKDAKFHAFDSSTGKLLWEHQLPAGGYATPSTYAAGGRQFVVIAAGGGGKQRTPSGDTFVAFALPASATAEGTKSPIPTRN